MSAASEVESDRIGQHTHTRTSKQQQPQTLVDHSLATTETIGIQIEPRGKNAICLRVLEHSWHTQHTICARSHTWKSQIPRLHSKREKERLLLLLFAAKLECPYTVHTTEPTTQKPLVLTLRTTTSAAAFASADAPFHSLPSVLSHVKWANDGISFGGSNSNSSNFRRWWQGLVSR